MRFMMIEITDAVLDGFWVKDLLATEDPGPLSSIIEDRIRFVNTGPTAAEKEKRTDIITSLILHCSDDRLRSRIEEATACIIHKAKRNKANTFIAETMVGVSALVRQNSFTKCRTLLLRFLIEKATMKSSYSHLDRDAYKDVMAAFAVIQKTGKQEDYEDNKKFWLSVWNDETRDMEQFWRYAFYGLLKLDVNLAFDELTKLISRERWPKMVNQILYLYEDDRALLIKRVAESLLDQENEKSVIGKTINHLVALLYNQYGEGEVNTLFSELQKAKGA